LHGSCFPSAVSRASKCGHGSRAYACNWYPASPDELRGLEYVVRIFDVGLCQQCQITAVCQLIIRTAFSEKAGSALGRTLSEPRLWIAGEKSQVIEKHVNYPARECCFERVSACVGGKEFCAVRGLNGSVFSVSSHREIGLITPEAHGLTSQFTHHWPSL
jgi:hypothetical protein